MCCSGFASQKYCNVVYRKSFDFFGGKKKSTEDHLFTRQITFGTTKIASFGRNLEENLVVVVVSLFFQLSPRAQNVSRTLKGTAQAI